jgi:hypothetical protein
MRGRDWSSRASFYGKRGIREAKYECSDKVFKKRREPYHKKN